MFWCWCYIWAYYRSCYFVVRTFQMADKTVSNIWVCFPAYQTKFFYIKCAVNFLWQDYFYEKLVVVPQENNFVFYLSVLFMAVAIKMCLVSFKHMWIGPFLCLTWKLKYNTHKHTNIQTLENVTALLRCATLCVQNKHTQSFSPQQLSILTISECLQKLLVNSQGCWSCWYLKLNQSKWLVCV